MSGLQMTDGCKSCVGRSVTRRQILVVFFVSSFVLCNYLLLRKKDTPRTMLAKAKDLQTVNNQTFVASTEVQLPNKAEHQSWNTSGQRTVGSGARNATVDGSGRQDPYPRCEDREAGLTVYGQIRAGRNYSVFTSTVHDDRSLEYLFDLPLTVLAWQRIGYDSIVILVVDEKQIVSSEKVKYVMSVLFQLRAVVVVLRCHQGYSVMISQVSRLFVPYLVPSRCVADPASWEDAYLVTSDADLWPLDGRAYDLPAGGFEILALNAFCCGYFSHQGRSYAMLPMANIGMKTKTWRSVVRRRGFVPLGVPDLFIYFRREFGDVAISVVEKGENVGWYLDQRMITILVSDWMARPGNGDKVRYVRRDVGMDRIDRVAWRPVTIHNKMDAHILSPAYELNNWHRMEALLVLMYDEELLNWCRMYATTFRSLT